MYTSEVHHFMVYICELNWNYFKCMQNYSNQWINIWYANEFIRLAEVKDGSKLFSCGLWSEDIKFDRNSLEILFKFYEIEYYNISKGVLRNTNPFKNKENILTILKFEVWTSCQWVNMAIILVNQIRLIFCEKNSPHRWDKF